MECNLLKGLNNDIPLEEIKSNILEVSKIMLPNVVFEPVLAIRLLILKTTDPSKYSIAESFMDHYEDRKTISPEYWDHSVSTVISPIVQSFKKNNIDVSFDEVCKAVGICEVNNYEIYNIDRKTGYRTVLPVTSLLSHSCSPNCRPLINRKYPFGTRCLANVQISKGDELSINYTHLTDPTAKRIRKLQHNWYFECCCRRCSDPNELGANLETIKCMKCTDTENENIAGWIRRKGNFKDEKSDWECDSCGEIKTNESVEALIKQFQADKDTIDMMNLPGLIDFMKKAEFQFHDNHHILTSTRRWVIPLLCRQLRVPNGAGARTSFPPELYKEKIDMCNKQLNVLNICEPGLTKSRGKILLRPPNYLNI